MTSQVQDSGLLVLGSDLVVETSMFTGNSQASSSGSQCATGRGSIEDFSDLEELQFLRREGVDRQQRRIVRIVGKFLPGKYVFLSPSGDICSVLISVPIFP